MLFLSCTSASLLNYHVLATKNITPEVYKDVNSKQLEEILLTGNPISRKVNIVELKNWNSIKPTFRFKLSKFNTTYINSKPLDEDYWKKYLEPSKVEFLDINPNIYTGIDKYKGIFTRDGAEYFQEKYKMHPKKWGMEIAKLLIGGHTNQLKFPLNRDTLIDLSFCKSNRLITPLALINNLGKREGTRILTSSSEDFIWSMLIGSDYNPPVAYSILKKRPNFYIYHYLRYYQDAVLYNKLDVKIGAVIFNEWLIANSDNLIEPNLTNLVTLLGIQ